MRISKRTTHNNTTSPPNKRFYRTLDNIFPEDIPSQIKFIRFAAWVVKLETLSIQLQINRNKLNQLYKEVPLIYGTE